MTQPTITANRYYRAVPPGAVLSLVFGLLSPLLAFSWFLAVVPVLGMVFGWFALRLIRYAPEEFQGESMARLGLLLSAVGGLGAGGWQVYASFNEVPSGYIAVTYQELKPSDNGEPIPARAMELEGKRIFVKGYMYPTRQIVGVRRFIISRDNGSCQFCMPNPTPTDRIAVELTGDLQTEYTTRVLALGGIFHVQPEKLADGANAIIYRLDADYLR